MKKVLKIVGVLLVLGALAFLVSYLSRADDVDAQTMFPPSSLIGQNEITSTMIEDGGLLPADFSQTSSRYWPMKGNWNFAGNASTTGDVVVGGTLTITGTCTGCGSPYLPIRLTASTTIAANEAVMLTATNTAYRVYTGGTDNTTAIGNTTDRQKVAQPFLGTNVPYVGGVAHRFALTGSPADELAYSIQTDSSGSPSGTKLWTATTTSRGGQTNTSCSATTYATTTGSTVVKLTAGTTYWLVVERTGALSDVNLYKDCETSTDIVAGGVAKWYDGAWQTSTVNDLRLNFIAGGLVPASALFSSSGASLVGIATESATAGQELEIASHGLLTGFTSLLPYAKYYLSDTFGSISTVAGTNSWSVGHAASSTGLFINP